MLLCFIGVIFLLSPGELRHIPKCVTGYMTDVQNWVNEEGGLILGSETRSAIDLSTLINPVAVLREKMTILKQSPNQSVRYISMAKCSLNRIPPVFQLPDTNGRWLSQTLEYITFYGNFFVELDVPGEHYQLSFNATDATEILSSQHFAQRTSVWSTGLQISTFPVLRELDLRACSIRILGSDTFSGMPRLEALYLGENLVHFMDADVFSNLHSLVHLDFSRNEASDDHGNHQSLELPLNVFNGLNNLSSLDLSFTRLTQRSIVVLRGLGRNLIRLSLCDTGLTAVRAGAFSGTSLKILDISFNVGFVNDAALFRGIESSLQVVYAADVGLRTLEIFKGLRNLEILQIAGNEIGYISSEVSRTWANLQILDLSKNRLTSWFGPTFGPIHKLSFLQLRDNNINVITDEMIHDMRRVDYLAMSGNFIVCNCHVRDFFEIAARNEETHRNIILYSNKMIKGNYTHHRGFEDHNRIIVERSRPKSNCTDCVDQIKPEGNFVLTDYTRSNYVCISMATSQSLDFNEVIGCNSHRELDYDDVMAGTGYKLLALLVIPCLLMPMFVMFIFRRNLRYCLITLRNSAMLSLINKKEVVDVDNTIFHYDVFVSYCNEDRGWVLDHLLPHLESDCSISACLHERDFQVGLSILENIVACMDRSRSIMLIISQRFLMSQWCQFEMHLAQHRLLETRREDLTLVLLEEIPRRLRPRTLHYLMLTKTYIIWPESDTDRAIFWKRLRKSLITQKLKQPEGVSLA